MSRILIFINKNTVHTTKIELFMQVRHLATLKHLQASCTSNHCAKLVLRGHVCSAKGKGSRLCPENPPWEKHPAPFEPSFTLKDQQPVGQGLKHLVCFVYQHLYSGAGRAWKAQVNQFRGQKKWQLWQIPL